MRREFQSGRWLRSLAVILFLSGLQAAAAVTASIAVTASDHAGEASSLTVSFNGLSETVRYDESSTANSVASGFAAMFSRDYLRNGLCAAATGNVITFQLKSGAFTAVTITGPTTSFQMLASGFAAPLLPPMANAGGPYTGMAGTAVSFSGSGSRDPQSEGLTYAWSFGDGGTGTGVSPTHTYSAAGTFTVSLTVMDTSGLSNTATGTATVGNPGVSGAAVSGSVFGGQQAVSGAHVYLLEANTTGYGEPSVSLLSAASTGYSDSIGAYVPTNSNGSFTLPGGYLCSVASSQLYLYAVGGDSGSGTNSALGLLAAIGNCPTAQVTVTMNEVTTVAAAYAFAGFATDATHVSSSGTALAQIGIANAFANAGNLATLSTGTARATTPAGKGTVPQAEINTLANILAACVETNGSSSNACSILFSNAMSGGSSGVAPVGTATAAINIAHNPGANITALYKIPISSPPFAPSLTALPNDLTIALNFSGSVFEPNSLAIDGEGNAWIGNYAANSVTKLSSLGVPVSGTGYTGGGLDEPQAIAIDTAGNAWMANYGNGTVTELSNKGVVLLGAGYPTGLSALWGIAIDGLNNIWVASHYAGIGDLSNSGAILSGADGYTGGGLGSSVAIAIDRSGDAWVANLGMESVVELSNAGAALSGTQGYALGVEPYAIAIDASGNAWIANGNMYNINGDPYSGNSVLELSGAGAVLSGSGYTGGGLVYPVAIAMDGSGNAWIANFGGESLTELANSGAPLSPSTGFVANGLHTPTAVAVDGSGDVWITNQQYGTVSEFIGIATPVVMPLSVGVKNNTLGTRP